MDEAPVDDKAASGACPEPVILTQHAWQTAPQTAGGRDNFRQPGPVGLIS